jgi:PAS domain S-box-containing protein
MTDQKFSEENYRTLINTMREGVWVIDPNGVTTFVNPRMAEMLGYAEEEMIGRDIFSFIDKRKIPEAKKYLERRSEGISEQFEFQYFRKDGNKIDLLFEATPMFDNQNSFIGALRCVTDINERKKSEIYNRKLIETSLDPLVTIGPDGTITDVNVATEYITGYSRDQLIGTEFSTYFTDTESL